MNFLRLLLAGTDKPNKWRLLMSKIDDLNAKADSMLARETANTNVVQAIRGVVSHLVETIDALRAEVEALKGTNVTDAQLDAVLAKFDAVDQLDITNDQTVAEAVVAGTPIEGGDGTVPAPAPDA